MANIKNVKFGSVMTMRFDEYDSYLIRLNFDLNLGDNFSYSHYIDSIFEGMQADCNRDLFIEFTNSLDLSDDLIIISDNNKELNTCVSDFTDHTRELWSNHCKENY